MKKINDNTEAAMGCGCLSLAALFGVSLLLAKIGVVVFVLWLIYKTVQHFGIVG